MIPAARFNPASHTQPRCRGWLSWCAVAAVLLAMVVPARAQVLQAEPPKDVQNIEIIEKLGEQVALDAKVINSEGRTVPVSSYFDGETPVILVFAYYECPMICPLVLDRLAVSFNELDYTIGEDFRVVVVSFNPDETTSHALGKKVLYTTGYRDGATPDVQAGWTFHTAEAGEIRKLTSSVGFRYRRLDNGQYAHPSAAIFLSGDGTVVRYIHGLDYPSKQIRLSLLDASEGRIAESIGDLAAFFCYHYDPTAGTYSLEAMAVMRIAGILTVIVLAGLIGGLFLWERVRRGKKARATAQASDAAHPDPSHPHAERIHGATTA